MVSFALAFPVDFDLSETVTSPSSTAGQKWLKTDYPKEEGLIPGETKLDGRDYSLSYEASSVRSKYKELL